MRIYHSLILKSMSAALSESEDTIRYICIAAVISLQVFLPSGVFPEPADVPAAAEEKKLPEDISSYFTDSEKFLRLVQSTDLGRFSVDSFNDERFTADSYKERIIRKKYDGLYRIIRREIWKKGTTAKNAELESVITYTYSGDLPEPERAVEELLKEKKIRETEYYPDGKPQKRIDSTFSDDKESDKKTEDCTVQWKYDSNGHIIEQETTTYAPVKLVQKDTYDYSGKGSKPDHLYYENGEIRIRTIYEDASKYLQTLYFDMGYSVEVTYEQGTKIMEKFLLNGNEISQKQYDEKK